MYLTFEEFQTYRPQKTAFALFGYPAGHSVSPQLHESLFHTDGFEGEFLAVAVPSERLGEAMELARKKLRGLCCTIPHKQTVIPLLDGLDPRAKKLGAVNVVSFENGKAIGYNTDIDGFAGALRPLAGKLRGKKLLLAGYGGAAAVIACYAVEQGARLTVTGRNAEKGNAFAVKYRAAFVPTEQLTGGYDIIVNSTPVGMYPNEEASPLPAYALNGARLVYDVIYNPPLTALLREASEQKIRYDSGLSMLVLQAAAAQTIWTGRIFSEDAVRTVHRRLTAQLAKKRLWERWKRKNIVLIGFMGSGKSTIGRKLARELNMDFVDMDRELESWTGRTIPEIFAEDGEAGFRKLETETARRLRNRENAIIATGGGAIETPENIPLLREAGLCVFLYVTPGEVLYRLRRDTKRPLLQTPDRTRRVRELLRHRNPIYQSACHIKVNAGGGLDTVRRKILHHI